MTATLSAVAARSASAPAERASPHGTSTRAPPRRASGRPRRSSLFTDPNPKRPLSHSQPQLTGSTSTPWYRRISLRLDCTRVRQPTEHVVHVLSTWSRSHGRALKRYGVAVRAPTGQIWTVLPLK